MPCNQLVFVPGTGAQPIANALTPLSVEPDIANFRIARSGVPLDRFLAPGVTRKGYAIGEDHEQRRQNEQSITHKVWRPAQRSYKAAPLHFWTSQNQFDKFAIAGVYMHICERI